MDDKPKPSPPSKESEAKVSEAKEEASPPPPPPPYQYPSHSPLAFSNYPPLYIMGSGSRPANMEAKPKAQRSQSDTAGASVDTLKAVLSTSSNDERKSSQKFNDQDPTNKHEYLRKKDRAYASHAKANVFGMDIGPLGKPPSMFGGWGGGRKKK